MSTEVRVDPLTGLKVIIATERAGRPGGGFDVHPQPPFDPGGDPFLPGHEDRTPPELHRVTTDGGGWQVRAFPNLYPAVAADVEEPAAEAEPDLFAAQPATGAHEVIVNAPEPVTSLADLAPAALATAMEAWRERMRAHPEAACLHLIVNEGHEGGASLPHTHAQLYALDFVPAAIARERERFGAHAVRTMGGNLLGDLVQEEVRRRERLVAVDDEAVLVRPVRLPRPVPAAARAPPAARPLRGRRPARRRAARRRPAAAARALRRDARAQPLGAHGAPRRRPLLLADRRRPAPRPARRARARQRRAPVHRRPGAGGRGAPRRLMRALVQRVASAAVTVHGEEVGAIGPGLLVLLGITHDDDAGRADKLADKLRALRIFPDAEGRMNEPLGDREVLCISQFTLYGDARKGNRPSYVDAARPEHAEPLYERVCERLGAARGRFGAHMEVALVNDGPVTLLLEV